MRKRFFPILLALLLTCQGWCTASASQISSQAVQFSPMTAFQLMINHNDMRTDFAKTLGIEHDYSLVDYDYFYMLKTVPKDAGLTKIDVVGNTFSFDYKVFIYHFSTHLIKGHSNYEVRKADMEHKATQMEIVAGHTVYYYAQTQGSGIVDYYVWEQYDRIFSIVVHNPIGNELFFEYCDVEPVDLLWPEVTINRAIAVRTIPYNDAPIVCQLKKDDIVKIISETKYRYFVQTGFATGYIPKSAVNTN